VKISNRNNYPDALVKAIENDPYSRGQSDYSVTQLLKPPRMVALENIHRNEMEDDVEDRIWSLYGQIAHLILERANQDDLVEKRFFGEFSGKIVSAQVDTLQIKGDKLSDWKFTTAWGFKNGSPPKPEWVAQLNMQLELLRVNGLDAKELEIIGLLRDWSKMEAKRSKDYPQKQVMTHEIEMWPREKTQSFINLRIAMHEAAKTELPLCEQTDRWAKPDTYAVMKKGAKRAISVRFSKEEAEEFAAQDPSYFVETRVGESIRCQNYCSVSKFCSQFQNNQLTDEESA